MIKITRQILVDVQQCCTNQYKIDGLTLIDVDGNIITFKSYPQMAKHLGLTKQGLYNKIRKNMNPIDKRKDLINKKKL